MKRLIISIIATIFTLGLFAQTNYYKVDKTFYENGYTYQCDVNEKSQRVRLYNVENKLTYIDQIVKSTGKPIPLDECAASFEDDNWTKDRCRTIIKSAFSSDDKRRLKGYGLYVAMYISSETGKITEVDFDFVTFNPLATIPVSVYRQIETQLKENVWFTPTEYGKGLNYIYIGWRYDL